MNRIKFIKDYINAIEKQTIAEEKLAKALKILSEDNYTFGVSSIVSDAYGELIKEIIGEKNFDWITWWMWDCDFGQKPESLFWIDNVKYDASGMVFNKFWFLIESKE